MYEIYYKAVDTSRRMNVGQIWIIHGEHVAYFIGLYWEQDLRQSMWISYAYTL